MLYKVEKRLFLYFNLLVLEPSFEHFLCIYTFFHLRFLQCKAYFRLRTSRFCYVQPFLFRLLRGWRRYFHGVAAVQFGSYRGILAVYLSTNALVSNLWMNVIGKVQQGCTFRKLQQIAFRCEHVNLFVVQVALELRHHFQVVACLQRRSDRRQPRVHSFFCLYSLVSPVRCQAVFGNFVHTFGAYLHLHPFAIRSQNRNVQTLVAVRFGHGYPIAQAFRIGLIHICYDRVGLPALHFLLLSWWIQDDSYGKQVVYALKRTLLLLHFLPDGVYRLRSALYMKAQSCVLKLLADRFYELLYVGIACLFRFVQLLFYVVIGIVFQVFQRQIFEFALQLIES